MDDGDESVPGQEKEGITKYDQAVSEAKRKSTELDAEIEALQAEGLLVEELDLHIKMLHDYNDIKDATQQVLGKLAELEGVTVKELHERYDLNLKE